VHPKLARIPEHSGGSPGKRITAGIGDEIFAIRTAVAER